MHAGPSHEMPRIGRRLDAALAPNHAAVIDVSGERLKDDEAAMKMAMARQ